jgi:plastocyanin domain-containing protein
MEVRNRRAIARRLTQLGLLWGLVAGVAACSKDQSGSEELAASAPSGVQHVKIKATMAGFEPAEVHLKQGRPAVLEFTRVDETKCVDAVKMPWLERPTDLPLNQTVEIPVPDTSKAGTFTYACWMNMVFGRVVVDPGS